MALTANAVRDYSTGFFGRLNDLEVADNVHIFVGAALSEAVDGRAEPLVAGSPFLGFALNEKDSTPATIGAGDLEVWVQEAGEAHLIVAGVTALTDIGAPVYASDDGTFTLTALGNSQIGSIKRVRDVTSTLCVVAFQSDALRNA